MSLSKISIVSLDNLHPPILLESRQKLNLGRNPTTNIKDTQVSRKQVELELNDSMEDPVVLVRFTGKHYGKLNSLNLRQGEVKKMKVDDVLSLLMDKYRYKMVIEPKNHNKDDKKMQDEENDVVLVNNKLKCDPDDHLLNDESQGDLKHHSEAVKRKLEEENEIVSSNKKSKSDFNNFRESSADSDDDLESTKAINDKLDKLKQSFSSLKEENMDAKKTFKAIEKSFWHEGNKLLVYNCKGLLPSEKIASFDLDGTLITTQSGKVFPTSTSDWRFLLPEIPGRLKELHKDGYKIVVFSNQLGLAKGKVSVGDFQKKVENIVQKIGVPMQVFIASGAGIYRKPCAGMWNELEKEGNDGMSIDKRKCFYVGDAAGRPKDWQHGKKKDFSCSDRLFATNVGDLRFETPEEFFLKQRPSKYELPTFDPRKINVNESLLKDPNSKLISDKQEVIILVGYPASGKSHFVRSHLIPAGYFHINRDILGSWQKCVKKAEEALRLGRSVAIDNTNPDKESRKRYITLANDFNLTCRCFMMNTSIDHSRHNEKFREITDKQHQVISEMIFNSYKSKFEEPDASEGFDEIVRVNLIPQFQNEQHKNLYQQFLL